MTTATTKSGRGRLVVIHVLFFLSGATALIYEIVWMGRLGRLFGTTAEAAASTLAAFFLGLGLGAFLFGRLAHRSRRPLRLYGLLEIGVAVAGTAAWLVVPATERIYDTLFTGVGDVGVTRFFGRVSLSVLWIGPAAVFMGGTFPVLSEALVRRRAELGTRGSQLYTVNTLGAAAGSLGSTFLLVPMLGFRLTYFGALALVALVGLTAVWLGRRTEDATRSLGTPAPAGPGLETSRGLLLSLAFASGLLALALQVLWTRMFALALPNSIYVFGIVIVVFLLALGCGGALARVLAGRRFSPASILAVVLALAGLLVLLTEPAFRALTDDARPPRPDQTWAEYLVGAAKNAVLVLFLPVLALGTVFPYLLKAAEASARGAGRTLGHLSALNTLGAIVGALAAGFVLISALGLWPSIRLVAAAYVLLAIVVVVRGRVGPKTMQLVVAVTAVVIFSVWRDARNVRIYAHERLLGVWEGPAGTVTVLERQGERKLVFNNVMTLGGTQDPRWEALQSHIPLCLHPEPRHVLYLGLGTGITAGASLDHPVEEVLVAEIVPEVIEAARTHFQDVARGLFETEGVRIVADDARHVLRQTTRAWDVVIGDLFFPWEAGTANLYTREQFQLVRSRLAEGGLFAQWLPCYQMSEDDVLGVAKTFAGVFPTAVLWRCDFFSKTPCLALVGFADGAARLDAAGFRSRVETLVGGYGSDLAAAASTVPLHLYAGNIGAAKGLLAEARVLTDDLPWIAYTAPRSERLHQSDSAELFVGPHLLAFEQALARSQPVGDDPYLAGLTDRERKLVTAGLSMRAMGVAMATFDTGAHMRALKAYTGIVRASERPDLSNWIK